MPEVFRTLGTRQFISLNVFLHDKKHSFNQWVKIIKHKNTIESLYTNRHLLEHSFKIFNFF